MTSLPIINPDETMPPQAPDAELASAAPADALGQTLLEFARSRGKHPQALRPVYSALMRGGVGIDLPAPTRVQQEADVIKFCLPVSARDAVATPFDTESVIIPMRNYQGMSWHTLCISSQIGCRMGCTFCQTGRMGLLRNLSAEEIVRQVMVARRMLGDRGAPPPGTDIDRGNISNIVFMGMGEPLDNLDAVTQAIRVLNEPAGLDFPLSHITVSTVGRIDGIRKLAELKWINLRLAISLNAATDALRQTIMPINKAMPLAELQKALLEYPLARKGRFLIEYVLLKGVNDSIDDARLVAQWCRPLPCVVNVIPYNPQMEAPYETPDDATLVAFLQALKSHGIFAKRRLTQGRGLMAACGQLGNPAARRVARAVPSRSVHE